MQQHSSSRKIKLPILFCAFLGVIPCSVSAASLTVSPSSLTLEKGKSVVVSFYVNDNNTPINAISEQISYPKDLLRLNSFSKNGSILQMWSEEPSFSNTTGSAHFEGVILNPGFSEKKGLIVTASFTALESGVATIRVISGNVYANDGKASDTLSARGTATYTIIDKVQQAQVEKNKEDEADGVTVTSLVFPREDVWYSVNSGDLKLAYPENTSSINYTLIKSGAASVTNVIEATSTVPLTSLSDGEYVFAVKAKSGNVWGSSTEYNINIDSEAPQAIEVNLLAGKSTSKISQSVILSGKDLLSGVERFDVSLNGGPVLFIEADDSGMAEIVLPQAQLRNNLLSITAYDKAGNKKSIQYPFYVNALATPTISEYTKTMKAGTLFSLVGKTYENAIVSVTFTHNKNVVTKSVTSNHLGELSLKTILENPGNYTVSLKVSRLDDGESDTVEIGTVRVSYSLKWIMSLIGTETAFYLLFGLMLAVISSLVSILFTKKIVGKKFEQEIKEGSIFGIKKTQKADGSQTKEGGF